jgi:hypothetical protein
MTYGQLKFRLTKQFPGVDLDLIEGWIDDRYAEILGELPWSRQNVTAVLQTLAPYSTGTVTLTAGSNAVALSGGTFTPAMTGMAFRVVGEDDIYAFTYVGAAAGTLDRGYEGSLGLAPGAGYTIFQHVYAMPADCRMLEDTAFSDFTEGPLVRMARSQLNQSFPGAGCPGLPGIWASYMDDGSTPPRIQVQLCPVPDKVYGIPFTYVSDPGALTGAATSTILQVWMQSAALVEGVVSRIKAHLKDYNGAQLAGVMAKVGLANMRSSEAQGMPPAAMQMDPYYTGHRMRRCR